MHLLVFMNTDLIYNLFKTLMVAQIAMGGRRLLLMNKEQNLTQKYQPRPNLKHYLRI